MPYVEGFGTWPFGEEWLWEAIATSYLPLLDVLADGAPITLSLTPVLCDQLEAPGAIERCRAFLEDVRPASHALDVAAADDAAVAAELERAAGEYARAARRLPEDLLGALAPYAAWTSAATHPILPLLATDAGAERSGNPWHLREYRAEEFRALCAAHFESVALHGLFHARTLRAHELALRAGWDRVHAALHVTKPFYDRFTPAISARDFALRAGRDLSAALDLVAMLRR